VHPLRTGAGDVTPADPPPARRPSRNGYVFQGASRYAPTARHPGEITLPEDLPAQCTPAQWGAVLELAELLTAEEQADCTVAVDGEFVVFRWERGGLVAEGSVDRSGAVDWFCIWNGRGADPLARALARTGDPT